METEPLVNRIANSGLQVLNLENFFPLSEILVFDLKEYLFKGLILREKEFRAALKDIEWTQYTEKLVAITCSADAIIPMWAYMLVSTKMSSAGADAMVCSLEEFPMMYCVRVLNTKDWSIYDQKRVIIKGCAEIDIPAFAYGEISRLLEPHAQSIMYGEPCSTVPVFKRPRLVKK